MKTTNAVKKLSTVTEVKQDGQQYSGVIGRYVVTFFQNGCSDEITCISTRRVNDLPDSMTDYFPQFYHDSLTSAIKYAVANQA